MVPLTAIPPDTAAVRAAARHELVVAFADAAVYFETHPWAQAPSSPQVNVRVEGRDRAEKLTALRALADSWRVPVITLPDGTLTAELVFGPLKFEAHLSPQDGTVSAYKARMAAVAADGETERVA